MARAGRPEGPELLDQPVLHPLRDVRHGVLDVARGDGEGRTVARPLEPQLGQRQFAQLHGHADTKICVGRGGNLGRT